MSVCVFGEARGLLIIFVLLSFFPLVSLWMGFERPDVGGDVALALKARPPKLYSAQDILEVAQKHFGPKVHFSAHRK